MSLQQVLFNNRLELIKRARADVAARPYPQSPSLKDETTGTSTDPPSTRPLLWSLLAVLGLALGCARGHQDATRAGRVAHARVASAVSVAHESKTRVHHDWLKAHGATTINGSPGDENGAVADLVEGPLQDRAELFSLASRTASTALSAGPAEGGRITCYDEADVELTWGFLWSLHVLRRETR